MENFSLFQDKHFTEETTSVFGERGERLAREYVLKKNYRLVCANFKTPVGRNRLGAIITGEIDLIAYDENFLCFIEVKTRSSDEFASPLAAVDLRKQRQIIRTARMYRRIFHLQAAKIRYDVVSIILKTDAKPEIRLFKNYFGEHKFGKKFWLED
ncbi:MAG TPA: YraN family protein [Pyrinomonadaceae bacterium]|jgi:putative endonuclease